MNYELIKKDMKVSATKGTLEMTNCKMPTHKNIASIKCKFEKADSFDKAVGLIRDAGIAHKSYAHYTSLKALIPMIRNRQWWLTRATSSEFDDLIESRKYGDMPALKNLFFVSFSYSQSESAAMWRLYSGCDENAARLSLTKTGLANWLAAIKSRKEAKVCPVIDGNADEAKPLTIDDAFVHDVIYASVEDEYGKRLRAKSLCWNDRFTKSFADLGRKRRSGLVSGVLKDYEWRFEYESRLFVKIASNPLVKDRIAVEIPKNVLAAMSFTRSPWVQYEQSIRRELCKAIAPRLPKEKDIVTPSDLTGALKKWSNRGN